MKTVVMSLPDDDLRPRLQHEVLSKLPEYTKVILLVPENRLEFIQHWLADQPYGNRASLLPYDPRHRNGARLYLVLPDEESLIPVDTQDYSLGSQHGTQWAQDLFESAVDKKGRSILLASCTHKSYQALCDRNDRQLISDNAYLQCLDFGAIHVQRLDVAFKGGNVLMDEHLGESIAFCGYDSARTTRTVWEAFHGETLPDDRIEDMLKNVLDVDKLVLIGGPFPQPELMYHLDQSMLLLSENVVAVPRVIGDIPRLEPDASRIRQVRAFLAELRKLLRDLGYSLIELETPVANVLQYQHYANAIPYIDDRTGEKVILFPDFPCNSAIREEGAIDRNIGRLESAGYRVVKVPTHAYELTGGIHCLVNVLQ